VEYVTLGKTGLKVSRLCLGMMSYGDPAWRDWVLPEADGRPIVRRAVEQGINFFDVADMYSLGVSEEITGRLLKELFSQRDEYVVATKLYWPMGDKPNQRGLSRKHIFEAVDASLRRLKLDYVDLYQIHRWDYDTPIEETMAALHDVVRAGKALYIGASSMWAWQFAKAQYTADLRGGTRFVSMQNHYNLVAREEEREMIPFCLDQGVALIPYSPLARGFLAKRYARDVKQGAGTTRSQSDHLTPVYYNSDADFAIVERVSTLAERHGATMAQIALAWVLAQPGVVSPIIGATRLNHLDEALGALGLALSLEDIAFLEEPYQPKQPAEHV
jgi:aryl-alcohol dehydrogenase-like predicted oxidoreductase